MTAANSEIYDGIVKIIAVHTKNKEALANVTMATNISTDLQVNSARFVDIVLDFEEKFDVEIEDDELDKIKTVGDAVNLLERLVH